MWQQMSECTISYMLGSLLFIIIGLRLMPLYFSNSVTLVSCGNIECYEVILIMADLREGQPSILGWRVTLITMIAKEKSQSHYIW